MTIKLRRPFWHDSVRQLLNLMMAIDLVWSAIFFSVRTILVPQTGAKWRIFFYRQTFFNFLTWFARHKWRNFDSNMAVPEFLWNSVFLQFINSTVHTAETTPFNRILRPDTTPYWLSNHRSIDWIGVELLQNSSV